jgi:hypothetical protein
MRVLSFAIEPSEAMTAWVSTGAMWPALINTARVNIAPEPLRFGEMRLYSSFTDSFILRFMADYSQFFMPVAKISCQIA